MGTPDCLGVRRSGVTRRRVLAINCGSTSLKFALVETGDGEPKRVAAGEVRGIGTGTDLGVATLRWTQPNDDERRVEVGDHRAAALAVLDALGERDVAQPDAVAHRVVHGGARFTRPTVLDAPTIRTLEGAGQFAPLHNAPALAAATALLERCGSDVPQIASFDTAFHGSMPARAAEYALPRKLAQQHGLRRYGFHGLAHEWMTLRAAQMLGREPVTLRLVTLQLGGGCSAAAVDAGGSIDTSMGLTPLEGLMMATRSGDIDPAVPGLLERLEGLGPDEVERVLTEKSGLLGVSQRSADMQTLRASAADGDEGAALAIQMFCYRVRKQIGAYMAALGGCDAVVFGGGIGEHQPEVRRRACESLEWAGIRLDDAANEAAAGGDAIISSSGDPVAVLVVHVEEELLLARDAAEFLDKQAR